jgi:hypothetical protein
MDFRRVLSVLLEIILYCLFPQGDGLYTNCSNSELVLVDALDMGYDESVQVVAEVVPLEIMDCLLIHQALLTFFVLKQRTYSS